MDYSRSHRFFVRCLTRRRILPMRIKRL